MLIHLLQTCVIFLFPLYVLISPSHTLLDAAAAKLRQSCPTLCDPTDRSAPGSSIHGILQARVLEWGAIAFSHCLMKEDQFSLNRENLLLDFQLLHLCVHT